MLGAQVFGVAFSASRPLFWAIKMVFGQFFKFLIIKGVGGSKSYPMWKKRLIFFYQGAKWNKKMGGRSLVIICGAFMDTLPYSGWAVKWLWWGC